MIIAFEFNDEKFNEHERIIVCKESIYDNKNSFNINHIYLG